MPKLPVEINKTSAGEKLPSRDWIAVSLMSVTNWLYPSVQIGLQGCFGKDSLSSAAPAIPNSACSERISESKYLAEYRFHSCGHRAGIACGWASKEPKLPRTDWFLLPLVSLLTVVFLVLGTRFIANRKFRESTSTTLPCLVLNDPSTGVRGIPNTVCWQKGMESDLVEYRFNSCGHRAGMDCGPKLPGAYRIVMIGSSINFGMWVAQRQSFAALLPMELSRRSGRKVELYNEAMQWGTPARTSLSFNEMLAEQPDMLFWALTPTDIANAKFVLPSAAAPAHQERGSLSQRHWNQLKIAISSHSIAMIAGDIWNQLASSWRLRVERFRGTSSGFLLQHLLYASRSQYIRSYLAAADSENGFLKASQSERWSGELGEFELCVGDIERQAHAAGVPLVAVLVPNRAQAAMISQGEWPAGYDPYKLDDELRTIIESHGGIYVDILPDFRAVADPEQNYFPVDGHPDAAGHALIAGLLAKELTAGAIPALKPGASQQVASAKEY